MKRYFALILTFALALTLLTSCELMVPGPTERPSIGPPAEPTEAVTPAPLPTVGLTPPSFVPAEYDPRYDDDPNFVFYPRGNMCATEDTFYFAYSDTKIGQVYHETICFLDKAGGYVGPLCGKPECAHDNADCNAYINGESHGLSIYDGRLYWMAEPNTYGIPPGIYSAALDGTDRRLVRELDKKLVPGSEFSGIFHRGWFYLAGCSYSVVDGKASHDIHVIAWPLDSDEPPVVILDTSMGSAAYDFSIQGYGDGIYIFVRNGYEGTLTIARWSPETRALETFYQGENPDRYGGGMYYTVREDGIFFVDVINPGGPDDFRCALYRYDFASGDFEMNTDFETPYTKYGIRHSWVISDDLLVMAELLENGELTVMAVDFKGNIHLDQTCQIEAGLSSWVCTYLGRDETNLYLYRSNNPKMVIAVALDGSGAKVLWDSDQGVH